MNKLSNEVRSKALKTGAWNRHYLLKYWGCKIHMPSFGFLAFQLLGLSVLLGGTLLFVSLLGLLYLKSKSSNYVYPMYHVTFLFLGSISYSLYACWALSGLYIIFSFKHFKREIRIVWIGAVRSAIRDEIQQEKYRELNRKLGL